MAINPLQSPINYAVDVQSPFEAALGGFKVGSAINEMQAQAQARAQALEQKQKFQSGLSNFFNNPNRKYEDLEQILPYADKQQFEALTKVGENMESRKLDSGKRFSAQVLLALESDPTVAKTMLKERFDAEPDLNQKRAFETILKTVDIDPKKAAEMLEFISGVVFGKDWYKGITDVRAERRASDEAPALLREKIAKAGQAESAAAKAAAEAKFADSSAALDLQKKGWDITKIQEDIKVAKQNANIAALNSQIAREGNQLKREEQQLKLQEFIKKRDDDVRGKAADLESARFSMDNMLNTADRILKTPIGIVGSAAGPISSRIPTTSQNTADFEALVDTLASQAFMAQIPNLKGMGALSNAEGEKLQQALQSFSLRQSPERLLENVRESQRLIMKARKNLTARSGLPESVPDTPAGGNTVNVGGQTYNRPVNFTDAQWAAYKQSVGAK